MLVAQANNSKAGRLDMPGNFPETAFQIHQGYAANNLFIQIYLRANTSHDQFLQSPTRKIFFSKNSDMDSNAILTVTPAHPSVSLHFPSALIGSVPVLFGKITTTHLYLHIDMKTQSFYLRLLNYQHDSKKLWF